MILIIYFYSQIVSHVINHEKTLREQVRCWVHNLTPFPEVYTFSTANERAQFLVLNADCAMVQVAIYLSLQSLVTSCKFCNGRKSESVRFSPILVSFPC
jgi:hypothetical protein